MRAFWAKVSGREVVASSGLEAGGVTWTAGVGAGADVDVPNGFALPDENGFAVAVPFGFEEKGFANGFVDAEALPPLFTPNSDSPIFGCGFCSSCLTSSFSAFGLLALVLAPLAIRTPRMPLTLPSFLRHVLRRQVQM